MLDVDKQLNICIFYILYVKLYLYYNKKYMCNLQFDWNY